MAAKISTIWKIVEIMWKLKQLLQYYDIEIATDSREWLHRHHLWQLQVSAANEWVQILTHFDNIPVFLSAQKCLWKEILLQIQVTYLCV